MTGQIIINHSLYMQANKFLKYEKPSNSTVCAWFHFLTKFINIITWIIKIFYFVIALIELKNPNSSKKLLRNAENILPNKEDSSVIMLQYINKLCEWTH